MVLVSSNLNEHLPTGTVYPYEHYM